MPLCAVQKKINVIVHLYCHKWNGISYEEDFRFYEVQFNEVIPFEDDASGHVIVSFRSHLLLDAIKTFRHYSEVLPVLHSSFMEPAVRNESSPDAITWERKTQWTYEMNETREDNHIAGV
ncbi:uncharacterized protein LOC134209852 [Armigeres subalbatus]|uniref:uncharacterized protein LOC134209852 n=1 Tax=Armigeres subalbatus TaxID=124917 RepID=UPI002ED3C329